MEYPIGFIIIALATYFGGIAGFIGGFFLVGLIAWLESL